MFTYKATFNLTLAIVVDDLPLARDILLHDVHSVNNLPLAMRNKVLSISWNLTSAGGGIVTVCTCSKLSTENIATLNNLLQVEIDERVDKILDNNNIKVATLFTTRESFYTTPTDDDIKLQCA